MRPGYPVGCRVLYDRHRFAPIPALMSQTNPPTGNPGSERRTASRQVCKLKAARVGGETVVFKPSRLARVVNISTGGVALHSGEPFPLGTLLSIRLHAPSGESLSPVLEVRIVRATQQPNGTWHLGAAFTTDLSDAELDAWLT
ncbi:MAG: PilZ domain-containing protein [Planctomycetia bacterium]|nr:PilZ domain-containing protein [Planctomycetia bacterium]